MNLSATQKGLFFAALLGASPTASGETRWELDLATRFSTRLGEIHSEIAGIDRQLAPLPVLPAEDQGGTGGFAILHYNNSNFKSSPIDIRWSESRRVDLIAVVPARTYDSNGLDLRYGMPEDFTVDLLDLEGRPIRRVATVRDAWSDPVRQGHPFVFRLDTPVEAAGLRLEATRLHTEPYSSFFLLHAWAEILAFEGLENVANQSLVTLPPPVAEYHTWHWSKDFLVDGETPLGLPELPPEGHLEIGWIPLKHSEDDVVWVQLDLGRVASFDAMRLFPAKRPRAAENIPGFALPRRLRIEVSDSGLPESFRVAYLQDVSDLANPGNNPQTLRFPRQLARYVKVVATRLWKISPNYPAYLGLSEIEVMDGDSNLAQGAGVTASETTAPVAAHENLVWAGIALTDGYGPAGRLIPERDRLIKLALRHDLELRKHQLGQSASQIIQHWRLALLSSITSLAVLGGLALVILPVRYRIRSRRDLRMVRERITSDLHDEVGSNLGSIQIYTGLAANKPSPIEELATIHRIAGETVSAVRDIVWLLRPNNNQRIGTVEHLRESTAIMLDSLEWTFEADELSQQQHLTDESNRHLFLFHREALHNILRHARASRVDIRVSHPERMLQLEIADDGCGISPEKLVRTSTLGALRQRCEALHGSLEIFSEADSGTRLVLSIPVLSPIQKPAKP